MKIIGYELSNMIFPLFIRGDEKGTEEFI